MANVAIIGSGFIGRAWAISYARAGHKVCLWDADGPAPAAALEYIEGVLPELAANDLLNGEEPAAVRARMSSATDLKQALDGVDHVQENTPENLMAWIADPRSVKPGAQMPGADYAITYEGQTYPPLNLNEEQIQALAAYLSSMR